jgi:hypothetical protein
MEQKLMFRQNNIALRRIYNTMGTFLESYLKLLCLSAICSHQISNSSTDEWYDLCRLCNKSMGQFFIERDEMGDINVAIILLEKNIFPYLISAIYQQVFVKTSHVDKPVNEYIAKLEL